MDSNTKLIENNAEKINKVEINMAEIKTDLSYIKKSQAKIATKLDNFIDEIHIAREQDKKENDIKYASKQVETALYWFIGVVGVIIITALLSKIII